MAAAEKNASVGGGVFMSVEQQRHVGPSNNIQQQIYDGMLSWEICPQSTSRMTVLSSQLL